MLHLALKISLFVAGSMFLVMGALAATGFGRLWVMPRAECALTTPPKGMA